MNKTAVILLSGGLDSLVSLAIAKESFDVKLALTFDYGQKAFVEEKEASQKIAEFYNIDNKIIQLPFLKEIANNALTNPFNDNLDDFNSVWIPNRNGLFLNIAAVFADRFQYDYIIFGANKEEAAQFLDNSKEFVSICDEFFSFATLKKPKVFAPCSNFDKIEIVNYAIENDVPLNLLKSCYNSKQNTNKKHCGKCMSCKLLFEAIKNSKKPELIEELF